MTSTNFADSSRMAKQRRKPKVARGQSKVSAHTNQTLRKSQRDLLIIFDFKRPLHPPKGKKRVASKMNVIKLLAKPISLPRNSRQMELDVQVRALRDATNLFPIAT